MATIIHQIIRDEVFPTKNGNLAIEIDSLEAKNLLLDLESQSKQHRETTQAIKILLNNFVEECRRN